jgi:Bacterial Ig-like domain (group 3)
MPRHRSIAGSLTALAALAASLSVGVPGASAADATSTAVTPSTTTAVWGEGVNLTATVQNTSTSATPVGSVQFKEGMQAVGGSVRLTAGQATITMSTLEIATHAIAATYTPDDPTAFIGSTSPDVSVTVTKAATTTTFAATPNPSVAGQSVTLKATVAASPPGAGVPGGSVQFVNHGGPAFDSVGLDPMGQASTLAYGFAGLYPLDANYAGDSHFNPSSGSVVVSVNRAKTTTTLAISPNPATPGATITYAAVVGIVPPGDVEPGGSLQFSIDGVPIGAAIGLGGGAIGFQGTLTAPPGGRTYLVSVAYSGDADTEPSAASTAVTIAAPAPAPAAAAGAATSVAQVAAAQLRAMVSTLTMALRLRGFSALTSTTQTLTGGPGVVEQKVYSPTAPRAARAAGKRSVVVASGRHRFATAGVGTLRLKLTNAGRRAIRHARSLKLAIVTRYTPTAGQAVTTTQRLTVSAKGRKRGRAAADGWYALGGPSR